MKKLLLSLSVLALSGAARGQAAFNTRDSLDINKINSSVLVHGDMWWNPVAEVAQCEFPKGTGKHANFAGSVWMSGYDGSGQLHIAAQTYRQNGNDYWPGPLDSSDTLLLSTSSNWAKIWKVSRGDIQAFQAQPTHTLANTLPAILTWPGKGNVNAQGNAAAALTITTDMAPFADLNGNGIYEPLLGEYPDVPGDQALWWVFSDRGPAHSETHGRPLGVEIHAMAYAYNRGTLIDNVQYFAYNIVNKSASNYTNFRFSLHDDMDLGYYHDDYIGFDSTWRLGYAYNGTEDDGLEAAHPTNSYGTHIPISGVTLVDVPGDAGTSYVPAGCFNYYNNDMSVIGNPTVDTEYNNYIRGKTRSGIHFSNDHTGPGIFSQGYANGPLADYIFTGNPADTAQWSECASLNIPGDRRFNLTTSDFPLPAGGQQKVVIALVITDTTNTHACGNMTGLNDIKILSDTAWAVYHNPPPALVSVADVQYENNVAIYPNPAHNELVITHNAGEQQTVRILNAMGQTMNVSISETPNSIRADISMLSPGVYLMQYRSNTTDRVMRFTKN